MTSAYLVTSLPLPNHEQPAVAYVVEFGQTSLQESANSLALSASENTGIFHNWNKIGRCDVKILKLYIYIYIYIYIEASDIRMSVG